MLTNNQRQGQKLFVITGLAIIGVVILFDIIGLINLVC